MGKLKAMALISIFLLLTMPFSSFSAMGDAKLPQWVVGDKWVYNSTFHEFRRTIEVEVTELSTVNVNGTYYDVYIVVTTSNNTFEGVSFSISVIESYVLRSNLAKIKTEFTETISGNTSNPIITTNSPPRMDYDFPLKVGKTWQSHFTESVYDGETYNNISRSINYSVMSSEYLVLESGTFKCYKIRIDDGFSPFYYDWYSPDVNNTVNATLGTEMFVPIELTSYKISGKGGEDPDPTDPSSEDFPYILLLIPIIIAVILVIIVVSRKKTAKKKMKKKGKKGKKPE